MSSTAMRKDAHWLWTIASFLMGLLLALGIFFVTGLAPFGDRILFMSDLSAQYLPFLAFFRDSLSQGEGWLYSFQNGIGGNMIPLIAYYLTSPLNWLVLPFANMDLPTGIHLLIALKMAAASGAMGLYLSQTYKRSGIMTVVVSLSYAFCGFAAAYFYNIMWLDALIWLPLVVLSLQQLVDKGKKLPYIFCLFLTIVSNYYLGYMICLFLVLYVVYWTRKQQLASAWRDFFRQNRHIWLTFIGCSLLAGMLTGAMLVPTVYGMLATGKGEFDFSVFLPRILFGLDGFAGFGVVASTFTSRLKHLPTFYVGMLPLLLGVTYFWNTHIKKEERKLLLGFLLVLFACTGLQTLVAVFQMFQEAAGFPFRNSFLFSFVLLTAAYENWNHREGVAVRAVIQSAVFTALGFVIAFFYNQFTYQESGYPPISPATVLVNLLLVTAACLFLLGVKPARRGRKLLILAASVFTMLELGFNFRATMDGIEFESESDYQTYVSEIEGKLEEVNYRADSLARIDNTGLDATDLDVLTNGYNEGMHFGYNSVASYTSTVSSDVVAWFQKAGTYSRNERRFSYLGSTPLTDFLLNVQYSFSSQEDAVELSGTGVAKGIGFTVPQYVASLHLEDERPFTNQNEMFQAIFETKEPVFLPINLFQVEQRGSQERPIYTISFQAAESGELYVWLPRLGGGEAYEDIQVDGEHVEPKLLLTNDTLLPLGMVETGQVIEVSLEATADAEFSSRNFQVFRTSLFTQVNQRADLQILDSLSWQGNRLEGSIKVGEGEQLFLSIPFEEDWQLQVDGHPAALQAVAGGFSGVALTPGQHSIQLSYIPKGMTLGIALSLLGGAGVVLLAVWDYIRKRR